MVWEKQRIYYLVVTIATIMSVWGGKFDVASTANLLVIDYAFQALAQFSQDEVVSY